MADKYAFSHVDVVLATKSGSNVIVNFNPTGIDGKFSLLSCAVPGVHPFNICVGEWDGFGNTSEVTANSRMINYGMYMPGIAITNSTGDAAAELLLPFGVDHTIPISDISASWAAATTFYFSVYVWRKM